MLWFLWFLTTNSEDNTSYKTMTLLFSQHFGSLLPGSVFRMELPSRYGRDALCVNITTPAASGTIYHLLNMHLDSLNSHFRHALQMLALAPSCMSPDVGVGSSQATSMQSSPRIIGSSMNMGCSMPGLCYMGVWG